MKFHEKPIIFECKAMRLIGLLALSQKPSNVAVLIVVGGPQYRSGSHRQFTILARHLAMNGISSLRFDHRGMGDSEGSPRRFTELNDDIRLAIDNLISSLENINRIFIWGLCDAASAILYYAHTDPRINGIILLNPWVHTEIGAERARLKHYYFSRLVQKSFWSKLWSGEVNIIDSMKEIYSTINNMILTKILSDNQKILITECDDKLTFIDDMLIGLKHFKGKALVVLSGNDLVSQEFQQLIEHNKDWRKPFTSSRIEKVMVKDANHTFSNKLWRNQVNDLTVKWINKQIN